MFPLLALIVLATIEFGAAFSAQIMLSNAAREAARVIAVTGDVDDATAAARSALDPLGIGDDAAVSYTIAPSGACTAPSIATVTVTVDRPTLTSLFGTTMTMSETSSRQCGG